MSEVAFAKQFLATIDKRPIKLVSDHVSDPRNYPSQSPFILPKQSHPYPRKAKSTNASSRTSSTVTVTLKPMRSGDVATLTDVNLDSTVHDIKSRYAQQASLSVEKIKVLYNKKPAADLKSLKELGVEGSSVELSVMIMGGGAATPAANSAAVSPAAEKADPSAHIPAPADPMEIDGRTPGPDSENAQVAATAAAATTGLDKDAKHILSTDAFWDDLSGFLVQRLRDNQEGQRVAEIFRKAYNKA